MYFSHPNQSLRDCRMTPFPWCIHKMVHPVKMMKTIDNAVLIFLMSYTRYASFPVPQSPSHRRTQKAKRTEPAHPAPVHLVDPPRLICQNPSKQHHKPGSVQVAQTRATPLCSESCPWERRR
ncbi:uncharacterized protein LOC111558779 [Felis catus]|uniref:uncharacterized protein LOC111558779 n=1 Tax=Felis catus TaxID=9685 RepID=UPI001D1A167F|nr:uncharacterized protein LOC111558779 [Felis catus]